MDEEDEALKELNEQLDMTMNDLAGVKAADNTVEEPKADKEEQSQSEAVDIPVGCPVLAFTEKTNQWYPGGIVKAKNADGSYKIFWTAFGNCSEHAANQVQVAPNVDVADIGKEDPKKLLDELKSFQDDPRDVKKATYFNSETEEWDLDKLRGDLQQAMLTNGMINLSMEQMPAPQSEQAAAPGVHVPATLPEDGDKLFELLQQLDEEADKENYYIEDEGWDIDGLKDDIMLAQKTVTAYAVGDRVIECGWLGSEYKGTVLKVDPEKQQLWVHYDGYDTSADRWVHCNSVRKLEQGEDVMPAPGDQMPTPSSPPAGDAPQQTPLVMPDVRPDSEDIAEILESLGLTDCAEALIAKGLTTLGVLKNAREEVLRSCGLTEQQSINELQFKIGERFKSKKGPLRFAYLISLDSAANKEDYYDEESKEWDVDGIEDDVRIAQGKISTASSGGDRVALWLPYTKRNDVVGDGGATIEKIKSTTSAKIKIGYENFGGYCRIIIEGSKDRVKKARSVIEETAGTKLVTKPPPGAMPNQNFENANAQMLAAGKNPKLMQMMQQMMMISQQMSMMRQRGMMEQAKMMQMQWMQQYQKMLAMYQQNAQKMQAAVQARKQQQMKSMAQNITGWQWGGPGGGGGGQMGGMGGAGAMNGLNDWIRMMGRSGMGQQMGWGFQQNEVNLNDVIKLMANDPNWSSKLQGKGQGPSLPAPSKDPGKDWAPGDDYPAGMVVHCRWENNGQWYQGQIQGKNADDTYKVFWPQWRNHSDSVAPEDIMAKRPCPQCGTENKAGANFCVVCGHSFAGRPNAGTAVQMQGWQWGPGPQQQRGFGRGGGGGHRHGGGGHRHGGGGPRRFGGGGRNFGGGGGYRGGGRGRRNEFVRESAQHMPPVAAAPPQAPAVTQLW